MKIGIGVHYDEFIENEGFCKRSFEVLELQDFVIPENVYNKSQALIRDYQAVLKDYEGDITIHGPYMDLNPISMDGSIRNLTKKRYLQTIEIAKSLQGKQIVIHTYFSQIHDQQSWYQEYWVEKNKEFWIELLPLLEKEKVQIVLENVFDSNPAALHSLVDSLDSAYFKLCLDVGHCHVFSEIESKEWFKTLGKFLAYVHVSDNNGLQDSHWPVGQGTIDYVQINRYLQEYKDLVLIGEAFCSPMEEDKGLQLFRGKNNGFHCCG